MLTLQHSFPVTSPLEAARATTEATPQVSLVTSRRVGPASLPPSQAAPPSSVPSVGILVTVITRLGVLLSVQGVSVSGVVVASSWVSGSYSTVSR